MNLFDILFMQKTGKVKPDADLFDILFAKVTGAIERLVTIIGNPISFITKKAQTAKSTKVTLEPVQEGSGDPSPTNIRPISGRSSVEIKGCGKNLFDKTTATNGYLDANGDFVSVSTSKVSDYIMVIPNQTYYFGAWYSTTVGRYSAYYDENKNILRTFRPTISGEAITIPSGVKYVRVTMRNEFVDAYQLELGSSATEYEPYVESNDVTITFPAVGANQWDEEWEVGDISSETGQNIPSNRTIRSVNYIRVLPETNYFYFGVNSGNLRARFYNANKEYIGYTQYDGTPIVPNTVFKTPTEAYYMRFCPQVVYGTVYNHDISINYPATVTIYEPYTNTAYSGTLDVEKGELVVDRALVDNPSSEWHYVSQKVFYKSFSGYNVDVIPMCNMYKGATSVTKNSDAYARGNATICLRSETEDRIYIRDDNYTDAQTFMAAITDIQIVYQLATPRTIQLTSSQIQILKGQNTLWIEDEGAVMELSYMD